MCIVEPFNLAWWGLFFFFVILFTIESILAQKKGTVTARRIFRINTTILMIIFIIYKVSLFFDDSYSQILLAANEAPVSIWAELPLQVCNMGAIVLFISAFTENRVMFGYCFLIIVPTAIMGCCTPVLGFSGYSLLIPRIAGYYFTHWMVVFCSISVVSFKLYFPQLKDLIKIFLVHLSFYLVFFACSMMLRWSGVYPTANYGFSVEPTDNPVLQLCWKVLPLPFLYIHVLYLVLVPYCIIVTLIMNFFKAIKLRHRVSKKPEGN